LLSYNKLENRKTNWIGLLINNDGDTVTITPVVKEVDVNSTTKMFITLLIICVVAAVGSSENVRYDNYALYKIHPQTEEDIKYLKKLEKENKELDFWKTVSRVGDYASVVTPPEMRGSFEHSLKKRSIQTDLMLDNIQE
jgi:hypothetical protein